MLKRKGEMLQWFKEILNLSKIELNYNIRQERFL